MVGVECSLNAPDYEYNGSVTSTVENIEVGDQIAAFVNGECRGFSEAVESPFETTIFLLTTHGNTALTLINSFDQTMTASNISLNDIPNSRTLEYFNIYRDSTLITESINEFYYIDEDNLSDGEYCYEIVLTDENGNEIMTSMEQCIEIITGFVPGDINGDGLLDVIDLVGIINIILTDEPYNSIADANNDGAIDIIDIVLFVHIILDR